MPQNVNPRDGVTFGADVVDRVSKEKSFVNCYPHSYLSFLVTATFQLRY